MHNAMSRVVARAGAVFLLVTAMTAVSQHWKAEAVTSPPGWLRLQRGRTDDLYEQRRRRSRNGRSGQDQRNVATGAHRLAPGRTHAGRVQLGLCRSLDQRRP